MTTYLVASSVSGVCVCAAMQPADTVLTRMYNREFSRMGSAQLVGSCVGLSDLIVVLGTDPGKMSENTTKDAVTGRVRGALYSNPIDCLWQTFRTEGIAGLYKGEHGC